MSTEEQQERVMQGIDGSRRAAWAKWYQANDTLADRLDMARADGRIHLSDGYFNAAVLLKLISELPLPSVPESQTFGEYWDWLKDARDAAECRAWCLDAGQHMGSILEMYLLGIAEDADLSQVLRAWKAAP